MINLDTGDLHLRLSFDRFYLDALSREVLQVLHITTLQLTKLDEADKNNWLYIPFTAYPPVQSSKSVELIVLKFRRDCTQGLSNNIRKVQEKSPPQISNGTAIPTLVGSLHTISV